MDKPKVAVDQNFVDNVRLLLIRMAQCESKSNGMGLAKIEKPRQYLEGSLGIDRKVLASED